MKLVWSSGTSVQTEPYYYSIKSCSVSQPLLQSLICDCCTETYLGNRFLYIKICLENTRARIVQNL
jgi:hypothetical protein